MESNVSRELSRRMGPSRLYQLARVQGSMHESSSQQDPVPNFTVTIFPRISCTCVYSQASSQVTPTSCARQEFMSYFSGRGYSCYALSLRGQGNGDRQPGSKGNTLGGTAVDIADFIASLAQPPVVVAHSFGGLAMQRCCLTPPMCYLFSPCTYLSFFVHS